MRTSIIITGEIKQIVMTPENESEKLALSMFSGEDDIEVLMKTGTFYESMPNEDLPFTAGVGECSGEYLRIFKDTESRILVLKPKEKEKAVARD